MQGDRGWPALAGRNNALNFLRLAFAAMVLLEHSWQIPTGDDGPWPMLGSIGVDGFFVISGYLIAGSRARLSFGPFLWRRLVRIMPGVWACLLVTAFAFAPIAAALSDHPMDWSSALGYVASNAALSVQQHDIAGLLAGAPYADWNSPLWTLGNEFRAYLIAGLILSVVRWRRASSWALLAVSLAGVWVAAVTETGPTLGAWRLLAFFAAGMVCRFEAARVPLSAPLATGSALALGALWALGSPVVYVALASLPFAYLVLWLGARLPVRVGVRNDVSYGVYLYGAPVQQILTLAGAGSLAVGWFAALSAAVVLPLAWASWLLVERPAVRMARRPAQSGTIQPTWSHQSAPSVSRRFTLSG